MLAKLPLVRGDTPEQLRELVATIRESSPKVDVREVIRAHAYAQQAHDGQFRKSGEAYITHPIAVATELAELGLDTATLVAALLHDVVEDTGAERDEIAEYFSEEIAHLVDGVTKLDALHVDSKQEQQAETLRKMILAMAEDIRVLVIKLADRLHNMATIEPMPRHKQKRIARETLDIYAPLAHRLGMQQFKVRLEDLGFKTLHPKRYEEIRAMVGERQPERQTYISRVLEEVRDQLREVRVKAELTGRPKHYYSIYEKMVHRGREFSEIYDLVGIRIITNSVRDCYAVLGQIHATWRPIPGRFKDYIAMPKVNLYQSLHTTVAGPGGRPLEIQIRTRAMHHTAEYGVAAHWKYKEAVRTGEDQLKWLQEMLDWQDEVQAPGDYLDALKIDLYQDEVFVFTPQGDVLSLPDGSTPIDFAYAIHTEVGHSCIGARVNDRLVPLDYELQHGDVVEILTSKAEDAGPSRDWMELAASTRAKSKIRSYFNRERRQDAVERGREATTRALRKHGIAYDRAAGTGVLDAVVEDLSYKTRRALFRAVGERHVAPSTVAEHAATELRRRSEDGDEGPSDEELAASYPSSVRIDTSGGEAVTVEGETGMLVSLAQCCGPMPGDAIVGYVTRGRGVSVHRADCPNVTELQDGEPERFVAVDWSGQQDATFLVTIQVESLDRKHLLRDITEVLGDLHINISSAQVTTRQDQVAVLRFSFELADPSHLDYALDSIERIEGVYDAYRVVPEAARG